MVIPPHRCKDSFLLFPTTAAGTVVQCPTCGTQITLGYGGRVPMHQARTGQAAAGSPS